ncbi:hypothetical protein PIB30_084999 [Stylosanthes scabra]|uniref:Putative plant transposon protein domain-containing protein n=1 Tax=Stylosanthes scabra TaxID=79078 RepID=A0ABU6WSP1_9FABA|nr:hypothetical protein [Stylosanthes scabra]
MGDNAPPSIILGRPFLTTGRALINVQKGELTLRVHDEQMVINVFKAMQYPTKEDAEKCMRIDVINMQIKEIQEEDTMLKLQAKYEERYDVLSKTNPKSVLQKTKDAPLKDKPTVKLKPLHTTPPNSKLLEDKQPFKFGVGSLLSTINMASSSAPASVLDDHRFRKEFNQALSESHVRRKKVILEVGFNLNDDQYPQIKEQIALRGWRRLAAPTMGISKLLVQEFYAIAAVSDEEVANAEQLPYKSFVRGITVDFSPENIRRVMRFKAETIGAETDYKTRQATDQRLDEVLVDLCIPGATWILSSSQPAVPIQLRRTELHPLAKGWQEFVIHSLVPTGNKSEITVARAILIHSIMRGEEVRAEDIIADNITMIAQGLQSKGNLGFPSTIYKLCKDASVPLREFRRTSKILEEKLITAKRMESTRIPRNLPQQQQDDDEDEPMPQAGGDNEEEEEQQQHQNFQQRP